MDIYSYRMAVELEAKHKFIFPTVSVPIRGNYKFSFTKF